MSQEDKDKTGAAETRTRQTKGFMQRVRVAARREYTPAGVHPGGKDPYRAGGVPSGSDSQ